LSNLSTCISFGRNERDDKGNLIDECFPLDGQEWLTLLLSEGRLQCKYCCGRNPYSLIQAIGKSVREHVVTTKHHANARAQFCKEKSFQQSLIDSMRPAVLQAAANDSREFVSSALVAHFSSLGVPPTLQEKLFTKPVLEMLKYIPSFPCAKTIRETRLPAAVRFTTELLYDELRRNPCSIHFDAGSSDTGGGRKIILVSVSGPGLHCDRFIHSEIMGHAERAIDVKAACLKALAAVANVDYNPYPEGALPTVAAPGGHGLSPAALAHLPAWERAARGDEIGGNKYRAPATCRHRTA